MRRRRRNKEDGITALANLVRKVYPTEQPEEIRAMRLFAAWSKVVSPRIAENARPVSYRNGILSVHTTTAPWSNALSFEAAQISAKLRARLPDVPVQRITFRVGRLPELPEQVHPEPPPPALIPLSQLPEEVARELARVKHDALRESLARAAAISLGKPTPGTGKIRR